MLDSTTLVLKGSVDVATIDTGEENHDGHLESPEFFDAEQSPQITFHSTVTEATADGQVRLQGVGSLRSGYPTGPRRRGGVATQRPAKPSTPVRFRSSPLELERVRPLGRNTEDEPQLLGIGVVEHLPKDGRLDDHAAQRRQRQEVPVDPDAPRSLQQHVQLGRRPVAMPGRRLPGGQPPQPRAEAVGPELLCVIGVRHPHLIRGTPEGVLRRQDSIAHGRSCSSREVADACRRSASPRAHRVRHRAAARRQAGTLVSDRRRRRDQRRRGHRRAVRRPDRHQRRLVPQHDGLADIAAADRLRGVADATPAPRSRRPGPRASRCRPWPRRWP
jgi:hypothetical protein